VIATLSRLGRGLELIDRSDGEVTLIVKGTTSQGGVVDLPVHSAIERSPSYERRGVEVSS
jgi:hypothetical protein